MVTPEMLLFLAGKMGLDGHIALNRVWIKPDMAHSFSPHVSDADFGRLVVWAAMQGLEPDFSHGIVRVWPIGKDYPCAEENDSTPDSIMAAATVAIARATGWEG